MIKEEVVEEVYEYIRDYMREHKFAPSMRNISAGCHMSLSSVIRYLDRLEIQGRIRRELNTPRSIVLTDEEEEADEF